MEHVMEAVRKAINEVGFPEGDGLEQSVREDLLAVLRRLPRELTVGEMLAELEGVPE